MCVAMSPKSIVATTLAASIQEAIHCAFLWHGICHIKWLSQIAK